MTRPSTFLLPSTLVAMLMGMLKLSVFQPQTPAHKAPEHVAFTQGIINPITAAYMAGEAHCANPPANFAPLKASPLKIAYYGLPQRPTDGSKDVARWLTFVTSAKHRSCGFNGSSVHPIQLLPQHHVDEPIRFKPGVQDYLDLLRFLPRPDTLDVMTRANS